MQCARAAACASSSEGASVAESGDELPDRRPAGLLRCARAAARGDRLLALARPPLRAGRPGQPRAAVAGHAAPPARARATPPTCLLGNHDLHLLAVAYGAQRLHRSDTLADILDAPDARRTGSTGCASSAWPCIDARLADGACRRRAAVGPGADAGAAPPRWRPMLRGAGRCATSCTRCTATSRRAGTPALRGNDRLRFIVNVLTRIRFCDARRHARTRRPRRRRRRARRATCPGSTCPAGAPTGMPIAFGHWSTLGLVDRPDLLALDTGCVWGGALTAVRVDGGRREVVQVRCEQAQRPGLMNATRRRGGRAAPSSGEMAEWSIALVLKTSDGQPSVGSNPSLSASSFRIFNASTSGGARGVDAPAGRKSGDPEPSLRTIRSGRRRDRHVI